MPDVSITNAVFASAVVFRFHRISDMDISGYSPFFDSRTRPSSRARARARVREKKITVYCLGYTGVY